MADENIDEYLALRQRHLEFTANVLRTKLREQELNQSEILEEIQEYHKLSHHLNNLSVLPADVPYSLLVDVGQDCLVQAQLTTHREVYLHIGMGFHVALPAHEAKPVIDTRIALLNCKASFVASNVESVKEHIIESEELIKQCELIQSSSPNK